MRRIFGAKKIRIGISDDNRELVNLLNEYISAQDDMEVIGTAYNGQECLTMVENKEPDVLILDIIMPHLDGLAVLERLNQMNLVKRPNIIMLTAFGQEEVTKKAVGLGAPIMSLNHLIWKYSFQIFVKLVGKLPPHLCKSLPLLGLLRRAQPQKASGIWMQTLRASFMKSAFPHILKAICIYEKRLRWFITISNCSARLRRYST